MIEQLMRKANPDAILVRVSNPKTVVQQISKARKLAKKGKKVIVYIADLDEICKRIDADTLAELLDGLTLQTTVDEKDVKPV